MLLLLVPGCAARKEIPLSPVIAPPTEEAAKPENPKVEQVGNASWYGPAQEGKETASGATFDSNELTAAHPTLPLGTKAVVTNLKTGKSVTVTITDRGPYTKGRKIDLSRAAAQQIGMTKKGVAKVKIESRPRRKLHKKTARPRHAQPIAVQPDPPALPPQ